MKDTVTTELQAEEIADSVFLLYTDICGQPFTFGIAVGDEWVEAQTHE